jgi:hypothetical protein
MKKLLWFSQRDEKPVIEIVMSIESAQWVLDQLPVTDRASDDLRRAIVECSTEGKGDSDVR